MNIEIANQQTSLPVDEPRIRIAVRGVLEDANIRQGEISIAVVDDPTIHALNRRWLEHDYPTDVLSFVLERRDDYLEGEIIVSADTARSSAGRLGWRAEDELLLYVVHGALHLVGCDDTTVGAAAEMRLRERAVLARFGLVPCWKDADDDPSASTLKPDR
jgi:probable rRNA maturation factor